MKDLRASLEAAIDEIYPKLERKRTALVTEMKKASPDRTLLGGLIDEISQIQAEIQKKAVENMLKEKEILAPDQQKKYFVVFEDHVCEYGIIHRYRKNGKKNAPCLHQSKENK